MDEYTLKLNKRKNDYGEYRITCYKNGKRYSDGDYFTDDWEDAVGTLRTICAMHHVHMSTRESLHLYTGKWTFKYHWCSYEA